MAPHSPTREKVIDLLDRAAMQAQHAEDYHAAVGGPGRLEGPAARQAACDAAAMQLIELAGYAEDFGQDRGEPGTTLARLSAALRPVLEQRNVHTHPEIYLVPRAVTPRALGGHIQELSSALENLDNETLRFLAPADKRVLNRIKEGLERIGKDGLPDAASLRPRDLHYAGYYREIQFARLAKATKEFDLLSGSHRDPRDRDVRRSISGADDMAHKFHELRRRAGKSELPESVVAPDRLDGVPSRRISELIRELRRDIQTPTERATETHMAEKAQRQEQYRGGLNGLAQDYAHMTGDPGASRLIYAHVARRPVELETIEAMREGLRVAADPAGDYRALPEPVQKACLELCFGLEELDDRRLIGILDAADVRSRVAVDSRGYSRWTGEPLGEAAGQTQSKGQSHR